MSNEQIYNEQLRPLVDQIMQIVRANGMSIVLVVGLQDEASPNSFYTSAAVQESTHEAIKIAYSALKQADKIEAAIAKAQAAGAVTFH